MMAVVGACGSGGIEVVVVLVARVDPGLVQDNGINSIWRSQDTG